MLKRHLSYSLDPLKVGYIGDYIRDYYTTIGLIKGDTRSLDYSSFVYGLGFSVQFRVYLYVSVCTSFSLSLSLSVWRKVW